jgi:hypothetical protein
LNDELFRQDGGDQPERAVVQKGDKTRTDADKQSGPKRDADVYQDRFAGVPRDHLRDSKYRVPSHSPSILDTAFALKDELAEVSAMEPLTWDLPEWRPAVVSHDILSRLKAVTEELKVVSAATDSLNDKVEALYAVPEVAAEATDDENTEKETHDG